MGEHWRKKAARAMGRYFERRRWPRLALSLVMAGTAAAGFGTSYLLLRFGVVEMWMRYPLAVLGAYLVFLLSLRMWVEVEKASFNPEDPEVLEILTEKDTGDPAGRGSLEENKRSWLDWLDLPNLDIPDSADGCVVGILILAALGVLAVLITTVVGAPLLLGEVAIDVLLVSLLYRRLKKAEQEHWLSAAVRQTWVSMLATAALLAIVGGSLKFLAPGSRTIGEAIRQWLN